MVEVGNIRLRLERVGVRGQVTQFFMLPLTRRAARVDLSPEGRGEERPS
jgi:hypothetical protein